MAKPPIDLSEIQPIDISEIAGTAPPLSVADKARASLKSKGLTPEDVKAGKGKSSAKASLGDNAGALTAGLAGMVGDLGASVPGALESLANLITAPPRLMHKAATTINSGGSVLDALNSGYSLPPTSTYFQEHGKEAADDIQNRAEHFLHVDPTKDTEAASYIGRTVPQVALAGTGLVKGMGAKPPVAPSANPDVPFTVDPEGPAFAPDTLGDNVNKALGTGFDIKTGKNAGKAAAILKSEIDHKMVSKDPTLLHKHIQSEMDHANLAGDQLLSYPGATAPSVSGINILEQATGRKPLLSPTEAEQWNFIVDYIKNELEAKAQLKGGLNSIKDIDSVKRIVQDRTNFDKLFSASDTVRNELLGRLGRGFDKVGDTLPGYRDLNDYRSNLIHLREQVEPIVEKAKNGVAAPSKVKALVKGAKGLTPFGNANDLIKAGVELSESGMTPVKIAKEINKAIAQGRVSGLTNPATKILSTVDKSLPFLQHDVHELSIPPQFAAGEWDGAMPVGARGAEDIQSSFPPDGPFSHSNSYSSSPSDNYHLDDITNTAMQKQVEDASLGLATRNNSLMEGFGDAAVPKQLALPPAGGVNELPNNQWTSSIRGRVQDISAPPPIREMIERQSKAANPIGQAHSQLAEPPKITQTPVEAATKARAAKAPIKVSEVKKAATPAPKPLEAQSASITEDSLWAEADEAIKHNNEVHVIGDDPEKLQKKLGLPVSNEEEVWPGIDEQNNHGYKVRGVFISFKELEKAGGSLEKAYRDVTNSPTASPVDTGVPKFKPRSAFATDEEFKNYQLERQKAILAGYK